MWLSNHHALLNKETHAEEMNKAFEFVKCTLLEAQVKVLLEANVSCVAVDSGKEKEESQAP